MPCKHATLQRAALKSGPNANRGSIYNTSARKVTFTNSPGKEEGVEEGGEG